MIQYPEGLPLPTRDGYGFSAVSPILRTRMQSGRSKQRRQYQSTPTAGSVSWVFTEGEAQLFESWWEEVLVSGTEWFEMSLQTPQGLQPYRCRFTDIYDGPTLFGFNLWRISAVLELFERPILRGGWAIHAPQFILYGDLLDKAINKEWPEA